MPPKAAPTEGAKEAVAAEKKAAPKAKAKDPAAGASTDAAAAPAAAPATGGMAAAPQPTGAAESGPPPPADSFEGVLLGLDWESIPNRDVVEKGVLSEFKGQASNLMAAYVYYCKASSECTTIDSASKLHLAGFKKLMMHAAVETPMFPADNAVRLFGKVAGSEMPAAAKEVAATTTVDLKGFLSLCLQLAFYRANPRYGLLSTQAAPKEGAAPKKELEVRRKE